MLQVFEDCLTVYLYVRSFVVSWFSPCCRTGVKIRYIFMTVKKVRKPCTRVSHLSHNWPQRRVTLWTILGGKKKNKTMTLGQHWTNADVISRLLICQCRGCILKTWFKKKKSLLTDITHTPYITETRGGFIRPPCTVLYPVCLGQRHSGSRLPSITLNWSVPQGHEQQKPTHETNCTFFKCKRTNWNL